MEKIKQKLVESGVIGDVVNNFLPRVELYVVYRHKRIRLGESLPLSVLQSKPDDLQCECNDNDLEMKDILRNYKFVIVRLFISCFMKILRNSYFSFIFCDMAMNITLFVNPLNQMMTDPARTPGCEYLHWYDITQYRVLFITPKSIYFDNYINSYCGTG